MGERGVLEAGEPAPLDPLIGAASLADRIDRADNGLVVIDATGLCYLDPTGRTHHSTGFDAFVREGHIPGARSADMLAAFSRPGAPFRFTRPDASQFASAASALGVCNNTTVVVYDTRTSVWACRLWWLFRAFGHERVAVLDGGLQAWRHAGLPLEHDLTTSERGSFLAVERHDLWAERADVEEVLAGEATAVLVCGTGRADFDGSRVPPGRRAGHIPGSISIPSAEVLGRDGHRLLTDHELQDRLRVVPADTPVIVYCGSGVSAAAVAFGLTVAGRSNVRVYDGSLDEWASHPSAPLTVGSEVAKIDAGSLSHAERGPAGDPG